MGDVPGSAGLELVDGIAHLDEPSAVFAAMLSGWERQQRSRLLSDATVGLRIALLRRFTEFVRSYPWQWNAGDVEGLHPVVDVRSAPARAVDDPRVSHDVALILRLSARRPL